MSSMREFYVWVLCVSSMCEYYCEFYVWVLCASSACEFYVRVLFVSYMCDLCERIMCVNYVSEFYVWVISVNKLGANWGQPDKFAEIFFGGATQEATGAQVLCASSACESCWQTNWAPTEANQTSLPKGKNLWTTEDHESTSYVCELCLPVLLSARRRAHKSISAHVCISKRTCGPTSAPETQNRPLLDFIKKSRGRPRETRWETKVRNRRGRGWAIKAYNPARTPSTSAVWGKIQ